MIKSTKILRRSNWKYITQQKRYLVHETILTTVALSPAGLVGLSLGLGFVILGLGVVMWGVPAAFASVADKPDLLQLF